MKMSSSGPPPTKKFATDSTKQPKLIDFFRVKSGADDGTGKSKGTVNRHKESTGM